MWDEQVPLEHLRSLQGTAAQQKNFGKTSTEEGHKLYFIGKADKHNQGIGFLVHKDIVNTVMGCRQGAGGVLP